MVDNLNPMKFEDAMREALKQSGHIKYVMMNDVLDPISADLLIKLSTNSFD